MTVAVNPLMSLLTGGGATPAPTPVAASGGFAAMLGTDIQANGPLAQVPQNSGATLPQLLQKLEGLAQKAAGLLEATGAEASEAQVDGQVALSGEEALSVLTELTDLLTQISQVTDGTALAEVGAALEAQVSETLETDPLVAESLIAEELVAAVFEITGAIDSALRPKAQAAFVQPVEQPIVQPVDQPIVQPVDQPVDQAPDADPVVTARAAPVIQPLATQAEAPSVPPATPQGQGAAIVTDQPAEAGDMAAQAPVAATLSQAGPAPRATRTQDASALTATDAVDVAETADMAKPETVLKVFDAATAASQKPASVLTLTDRATGQQFDLPKELLPVVPHELSSGTRDFSQQIETLQNSQPPRAAESQSARFASAIVNQVRAVELEDGVTRVELTPRGLGTLEIEMTTKADGSLSVVVRAENNAVLTSLREDRALLAEILPDSAQSSLDFQEFEQPDQRQSQGQSGAGFGTDAGDAAESEMEDAQTTATIGNGQLDLMT